MKAIFALTLALLSLSASAQSRLAQAGNPAAFQILAELTGVQPEALLSDSVAISGNTLVIGAPLATAPDGCITCGAAYVYTAVGGDWTNLVLTATLTQSKGQFGFGGFGDAVAISGDTIVVGGLDRTLGTLGEGAAYIYDNPSGIATENAELTITNVQGAGTVTAVAIDGDVVVLGDTEILFANGQALGAAYVYVKPSGGWASMAQTAQLSAADESSLAEFGISVGISGRTVVVGAPRATVGGLSKRGRAYIFVEPGAGWGGILRQRAELQPSDGVRQAEFGNSVSVSGGAVVVGAPGESVNSNQAQGVVYVYVRPPSGWPQTMTETAQLTAGKGKSGAELGYSVAISGATVLSGAPFARVGQGISYIFREPAGGWQNVSGGEPLTASDAAPFNGFGTAVGIGGGVLAISAPGWPDGGTEQNGAVYVLGSSH